MAETFPSASDLPSLPRRTLQSLVKRADVQQWATQQGMTLKANAKNADIIDALALFSTQMMQASSSGSTHSTTEPDTENALTGMNEVDQQTEMQDEIAAESETRSSMAAEAAEAKEQEQAASIEPEVAVRLNGESNVTSTVEPPQTEQTETEEQTCDIAVNDPMETENESKAEDETPEAPQSGVEAKVENMVMSSELDVTVPVEAGSAPTMDAQTEELCALEDEIGALEAELQVQADDATATAEQEPVADAMMDSVDSASATRRSRSNRSQSRPQTAAKSKSNKKKGMASSATTTEAAPPSRTAHVTNRSRTLKKRAPSTLTKPTPPTNATNVAPSPISKPLFTKKAATTKHKKKAVSKSIAPSASPIAAARPVPSSPPPNSLASAFSLPSRESLTQKLTGAAMEVDVTEQSTSSASTVASTSSTSISSSPSTSSSSSSAANDAYWSLMFELDARVGQRKAEEEANGAAAPTVETETSAKLPVASPKTQSKIAAKFDRAHKKQAKQSESIVDYYNKLAEKKRAAQAITTPLTTNTKRRKTAHGPAASPSAISTSTASTAPFHVAVPLASAFSSVSDPMPSFTPGTSIAKRTRGSLKRASEKQKAADVAQKTMKATHKSKLPRVAQVAASSSSSSNNNASATATARPLFQPRLPNRPTRRGVAPPASTTAPDFSLPSVIECEAALDVAQSTSAAKNVKRKKFDLEASLAKPLTWKPHKGKIPRGNDKDKEKEKMNKPAPRKEESQLPSRLPSIVDQENQPPPPTSFLPKPCQDAFAFDAPTSGALFTASQLSASPRASMASGILRPSAKQQQPRARAQQREHIKTHKFGADKDTKRAAYHDRKSMARRNARAAARENLIRV